jgi:sister chromatid cohesion protein PDS5
MKRITGNLKNIDDHCLEAHLYVLAEIARSAPDAFEGKSDVIIAFLIKEVLVISPPRDEVCAG